MSEEHIREILIDFLDDLRDYMLESDSNLAYDDRESKEIVDIYVDGRGFEPDLITKILDAGQTFVDWKVRYICVNELKTVIEFFGSEPRLMDNTYSNGDWDNYDDLYLEIPIDESERSKVFNFIRDHDWTKPIYWEEE